MHIIYCLSLLVFPCCLRNKTIIKVRTVISALQSARYYILLFFLFNYYTTKSMVIGCLRGTLRLKSTLLEEQPDGIEGD